MGFLQLYITKKIICLVNLKNLYPIQQNRFYNKAHELIVFSNGKFGYISDPAAKIRLGKSNMKFAILSGIVDKLNEDIRVVNKNITSFLSDIKEEVFTPIALLLLLFWPLLFFNSALMMSKSYF